MRLMTPSIMLLSTVFSIPSFACGFKAEGIRPENLEKVRTALNEINSEFEINDKTGEIHFSSKERVTLHQVEETLKKNNILGINIAEREKL